MTLEISNLTKIYGTQRAVDNISFSTEGGQILGFLGPNGAGKSTTMKMITSYIKQDEGNIKVMGMDTIDKSLQTRKQIGYLPEHNPLYLDMYVKEYLNFVCDIHKLKNKKQTVNDIIEKVGLNKEQHKIIGTLSKGYRQRVGLAQAIIHDPEILILDEPTSGLDMNQLQDIRKLIKELGKEKTVIFSTHIMQEVQALCDRVIIINNGKLVADDPIERLADKVRGEGVIFLELDAQERLDIPFESIQGVSKVVRNNGKYTIYHDRGMDPRRAIFQLCVDNNQAILGMQKQEINVEDVFQKLTV